MNKLRARLNAGCLLLWISGVALALAFSPIDSAMDWIAQEAATFKAPPATWTAIEVAALVILGPIVIGTLAHIRSEGFYQTFARIFSFWWAGLKSGIVCLLLLVPFFVIRQVIKSVAPNSLFLVLLALLCISAPFWSLLLIRRLPKALLSGTLFERFDPEMFSSDS